MKLSTMLVAFVSSAILSTCLGQNEDGVVLEDAPINVPKNVTDNQGRLVYGTPAGKNQFPYQAGLYYNFNGTDYGLFCGGSLIHPEWILTPAHCVKSISSPRHCKILLGSNMADVPKRSINMIIIHPVFNQTYLQNDLALLHLTTPVEISDSVKVIPLADTNSFLSPGTLVWVSGWGILENGSISAILRYVQLEAVSNAVCRLQYKAGWVPDQVVCTKGVITEENKMTSTCQGDSGGPLVVADFTKQEGTLVGIVSFVISQGCNAKKLMGFYRVANYTNWISTEITRN